MNPSTNNRADSYRKIYQARPSVERSKREERKRARSYEKDTVAMIAEAHKAFWLERGYKKPPYVSKHTVGVFANVI